MKIIAANVGECFGTVNLETAINAQYSKILTYGEKKGWPLSLGIVRNGKKVALADISDGTDQPIICSTCVEKEHSKTDIIKALQGEINFLF